jgi:hypothetical protein
MFKAETIVIKKQDTMREYVGKKIKREEFIKVSSSQCHFSYLSRQF